MHRFGARRGFKLVGRSMSLTACYLHSHAAQLGTSSHERTRLFFTSQPTGTPAASHKHKALAQNALHTPSSVHSACVPNAPYTCAPGQLHAAAPFLRSFYQKMPDFPPCVCDPTRAHAQSTWPLLATVKCCSVRSRYPALGSRCGGRARRPAGGRCRSCSALTSPGSWGRRRASPGPSGAPCCT